MHLIHVPAGADFLWSDLKTFSSDPRTPPQIRGLSSMVDTTSGILWVGWLFFHDVVAPKKKIEEKNPGGEKKSYKQLLQKWAGAASEQGESWRSESWKSVQALKGFEMFALEQENNTIITVIWTALRWGHFYRLSPRFSNINQ